MTDIISRLAAHGFMLESTGGACTAFVRTDGEIQEIITLADRPQAPRTLSDAVAIGTAPDGEMDESPLMASLADVLAALDNPADEYTLLNLRLQNGYHRAATV